MKPEPESPSAQAISAAARNRATNAKIDKAAAYRRPRGRPAKYLPRYATDVIDFCREGFTIGAFAASIDVNRSTLYEWARAYPEFSDALQRARGKGLFWYERAARMAAVKGTGPGGATIISLALRNFGREDWTERRAGALTASMPAVDGPKSAAAAIAEALRAYAAGEIDAAEAKAIAELARAYQSADEQRELAERVAMLEAERAK